MESRGSRLQIHPLFLVISNFMPSSFFLQHYLEVRCTSNLLSNCSYDLIISPITTVALDIIGL